jgi:hypothetical protein
LKRSLKADLSRVRTLAFRRLEKCERLIRGLYGLRGAINRRPEAEVIWKVYDWLVVPLSLWPIDFEGLAGHLIGLISKGEALGEQLDLLLRIISEPPSADAQKIIGEFEHDVQGGSYEKLVSQPGKFTAVEAELISEPDLNATWRELKAQFKLDSFKNRKGVIRRRLSQERNFRDGWKFQWRTPRERFLLLFDALCCRWDLYGFEHDKPLLLKISVNPTPYGTMIVIPRHWSLDQRRDLKWAAIAKLHRAHGATRQGPKLSVSRVERQAEAHRVRMHHTAATLQGLRGDRRTEFILKKMGKDPRTDSSYVKRMLKLAEAHPQPKVRD